MKPDIFSEITGLRRKGTAFSMATIVSVSGSAPRRPGTRMLVTEDGTCMGSIGGGVLERAVKDLCIEVLSEGECRIETFSLESGDGEMACGGTVQIFIEPILPESMLFILGSGHVAKALGKAASFCGIYMVVLDKNLEGREDDSLSWAAQKTNLRDFSDIFPDTWPSSRDFIVIATGTHEDDFSALVQCLETDACFIGLLGSRRKWASFSKRLLDMNYSTKDLERVSCPVGLEIGAQGPEEIAVSIVAQIIEKKRAINQARLG